MVVQKILGNSAFWIINKEIASLVGIDAALLLADIIDKQHFFEIRSELDDEGFFYNTAEDISKDTTLTYHLQKQAMKRLFEVGFLETKLKGVPAKLHFKVVENKILKFLNTGIQKDEKQDLDFIETNKNKSINNKKEEDSIPIGLFNNEEIKSIPDQVLEYLNLKKGGRGFEKTASNLAPIKTRLKEKFTIEDLKKVIDVKVGQWKDDAKMKSYLRPETLFGGKFNAYLIEAETANDESRDDGSGNYKSGVFSLK